MPTIPTALVITCESALASGVLQPIKTDFYVLPIFWHWPGVGYIPTFKTLPAVPENTPFTVRLTQVKDDLVMEVGPNARNNFGAWADHAVGIARKVLGSQRPA
jgi:hypothetical protein